MQMQLINGTLVRIPGKPELSEEEQLCLLVPWVLLNN